MYYSYSYIIIIQVTLSYYYVLLLVVHIIIPVQVVSYVLDWTGLGWTGLDWTGLDCSGRPVASGSSERSIDRSDRPPGGEDTREDTREREEL